MKDRSYHTLRQKMIKMRQEGHTYGEIAIACGALKKDGKSNRGMVYRIIHEGYEPMKPETRERLGLPALCPYCKNVYKPRVQIIRKDLLSVSKKELARQIEERETFD